MKELLENWKKLDDISCEWKMIELVENWKKLDGIWKSKLRTDRNKMRYERASWNLNETKWHMKELAETWTKLDDIWKGKPRTKRN